jgi:HAD superfamily hydrolase (TIGR01509 family)
MSSLVIFDMDGVLIDSEPVHLQIDRELMSMFGITISESELCGYVGMSPRGMWTAVKARHGLEEDLESLLEVEASTKVREFGRLPLQPMPGVENLIQCLVDERHSLAIASSSSKRLIETITSKLNLNGYFPHRISAEDVENGKPHPDIFLRAAKLGEKKPAECVVIEDSCNGLRAASAADMASIGFANVNSGDQDLSAAHLVVDDFGDANIQRILNFVTAGDAGE